MRLPRWFRLAFPAAYTHERSTFTDHGSHAWATKHCAARQFMVGTQDSDLGTTIIAVEVAR